MNFNNTFPEWENEGIAPSENLRANGFQAGDRPAAATFNWFWSKVPKAVTEIQDSLNNVEKNVNNSVLRIEASLGMTKSKNLLKNTHSIGLTTINGITFTTNADGSVTANGTATADANYNIVVALPQNTSFILSGCPSGGSASTYNIFAIETDSFVQAYRDIGNGAEFNTGSYTEWSFRIRVVNGQTVSNIKFYPMLRNADLYSDDVEYEPYNEDLQTQINELNAPTATKLQTARQINGVAFDGSKNITVPINGCYHYDDSSNVTTASWHKVASCTLTKGSYDTHAVFHVYRSLGRTPCGGILKAHIRTTSEGLHENSQLVWEYAYNIPKEDFVLSIIQNETDKSTTAELWVKINIRYAGYQFALISESNRTTARNEIWTLYNSSVGQAAYTESDIVTVSDDVDDSGWVRTNMNASGGEAWYRKCGKMVEFRCSAVLLDSGLNEWNICTLPENNRPSVTAVNGVATVAQNDSQYKMRISTEGVVSVLNSDKTLPDRQTYQLHACFLVD